MDTVYPPACSHIWIDPEAPPIERKPIAPIIGSYPEMMRRGKVYKCQNCGMTFKVPYR